MKKNAFTLIELLAVIVILAIIALIAVPIVIHIVNDSKNSSEEQTVELYLDTVEKTITKKQLGNPNFNPDKCEIQTNGSLECFKEDESLGILEVNMKGKMPNNGKIKIKNNKFKFQNILFNNKIYYETYINLIYDEAPIGLSIGDKYTYKVNNKDTYTFYILSINSDNTVNLIMNRNICEDGSLATAENTCLIAWYSSSANNSYGPITAMQGLYNATKNWNNVPDMNLDYEDEGRYGSYRGYRQIKTNSNGIQIIDKNGVEVTRENNQTPVIPYEEGKPLKARLPKLSEIYNTDTEDNYHCHNSNGSCPKWLVENLASYSTYLGNEAIAGISGYWSLSSRPGDSGSASYVYYTGNLSGYSDTNNISCNGLRAVITVSKDDLL